MTDTERAALHALCFDGALRPWSAAEFAGFRADARVLDCETAAGFILARVVADEAEILTLAVHPEHRRLGTGREMLAAIEARARKKGAAAMFLEVADDNIAARKLYEAAGYAEAGSRANYYRDGRSAIVLKKHLG